jgi:hypothetical protein
MSDHLYDVWDWIKSDWKQNPFRFCLEVICWVISMTTALIINATVPNLPFLVLYPLWVGGTLTYAWCAWSRGSFGMLATFLMIASMDIYGWIKVLNS